MALLCAALVLAITSLSAYIRLSRAGLGCEPWPQCYAQSLRDASEAAPPPTAQTVAVARLIHRVVAVAALVVIVMMVMTALLSAPILWREARLALALLALAVFLAVLGRWTAGARVPAVVLGNLLAGFAMFALACRLVSLTSKRPPGPVVSAAWVVLAGVVLVMQLALGGLASAGHAGISCPELARCDPSAGSWQALNPWHAPRFDAADPVNAAGALLAFLHRAASLLVLAVLLPLGIVAWRRQRRAGAVLVLLLAVQVVLGALLVATALPLPVALAHNLVGALLLAALAGLNGGAAAAGQENSSGSPAGSSAR
ncbi:MAG TPA: COX15/CtaA family protein [Ramlibacter sp.]|nr:COX15/CtaA family protein [Ramlibacter sp.]